MTPATVRLCAFSDIHNAANFWQLMDGYAQESANAGLGTPKAQTELYAQLENAGFMHIFGAFLGDEVIGFLVMTIYPLTHYPVRVCATDSFFVAPAHRKSGAGLKLLKAAETHAKDIGAAGFFISAPTGGTLSKVMSGVGYSKTNETFFKALT